MTGVQTCALPISFEAAIVANFAAGVEVGKSGAAMVTAAEVMAAYDAHLARG